MMATPLSLPTVEEIEAADEKLSSALSDLDNFTLTVGRIDPETSTEEALRIFREDLPFPEPPPFEFDAEAFARLLVFANDAFDDADDLRKYADKLRVRLLWMYRARVLDTAARAEGAIDDA